jgi:hypothetical protein
MSSYRSVSTLLNTTYTVGDVIGKGTISDITIDECWGDNLAITVWARPTTPLSASETTAIIIPYHAVELMVK